MLRNIATAFPVEPVGVGAKWELSESMVIVGMRVTHATTVTVDAIDGDTVTMTHHVAQTAPRQPMDLGFTGDITANLISLHANGSADNVQNVGFITPSKHDYEMLMRMELEIETPKEPEGPAKPGEPVVRLNKGDPKKAPKGDAEASADEQPKAGDKPQVGDPRITEGFTLVGQEIRITLKMARGEVGEAPAPAKGDADK